MRLLNYFRLMLENMLFIAKYKCLKGSFWFFNKTKRIPDAYSQAEDIKGVV